MLSKCWPIRSMNFGECLSLQHNEPNRLVAVFNININKEAFIINNEHPDVIDVVPTCCWCCPGNWLPYCSRTALRYSGWKLSPPGGKPCWLLATMLSSVIQTWNSRFSNQPSWVSILEAGSMWVPAHSHKISSPTKAPYHPPLACPYY